ncbi:MAG: GIY-YIG nuclease family protein [Agriterribacter sp.]
MYFVYILYSRSIDKYYVGSSEDVERRIVEHNMGKGNFTSKGIPWIVVITFECESRTEAVRLELKIKKRGIKRYLQDNNAAKSSGSGAAR